MGHLADDGQHHSHPDGKKEKKKLRDQNYKVLHSYCVLVEAHINGIDTPGTRPYP